MGPWLYVFLLIGAWFETVAPKKGLFLMKFVHCLRKPYRLIEHDEVKL